MNNFGLSEEEIASVIGFLGYGTPTARTWFVGLEEGLGEMDDEEAAPNLKARGSFSKTMDLFEAHVRLMEKKRPINIEHKQKFTNVWIWMAKIARARRGAGDWADAERAKDYVRYQLGRKDGTTFLTELSSIPVRGHNDRTWIDWFRARSKDFDIRLKTREQELLKLLHTHNPSVVICYGKGRENSPRFKSFCGVKDWTVMNDHVEVSSTAGTRFLLLPFFGHGHMSHRVVESLLTLSLLK